MEKLFTLVPCPQTKKLIAHVDGSDTELTTCIVIGSWDKQDQSWYWKINLEDPKSDPRIKNARYLVSTELYRQGVLEYAGRDVAIGRHGTGIILGSGKPYVRAIDITVADFMKENKIATLMKEPPATDRIRSRGATITFRVFDLGGREVKPVAGSFMLDPEQPWVVEHRRVMLSNVSTWKGLYVPQGYKFIKEEAPATPAPAVPAAPAEESISHVEEAVMAPNSSEETFNTIGDAVGTVLDTAVPETSATEIPLEVEQAPVEDVQAEPTPVASAGLAVAAAAAPTVTSQSMLG